MTALPTFKELIGRARARWQWAQRSGDPAEIARAAETLMALEMAATFDDVHQNTRRH